MYRTIILVFLIFSNFNLANEKLVDEKLDQTLKALKKIQKLPEKDLQIIADNLNNLPFTEKQKLRDSLTKLKEQQAIMDEMVNNRNDDCLAETNNLVLCNCLKKDLPASWSFEQYVSISTKSRSENNYDDFDDIHKFGYSVVEKVAEKCGNVGR